jgi:Rod binding domain-containing protein
MLTESLPPSIYFISESHGPEVPMIPLLTKQPSPVSPTSQLRTVANEMETAFLAEMLKYSGVGDTSGAFGAGAGGEHFASFLREEQARIMVEGGGIGLSESIFRALSERPHD